MSAELSTPMTRCPHLARNSANRPVPHAASSATPSSPAGEVLSHYRLVGSKQPAASLRVVAGRHLLVNGGGADLLNQHAAVPQLLVIQQPPDLGQPGLRECAVVVSGPGVQQRDALEAEQIGQRVLINHERGS